MFANYRPNFGAYGNTVAGYKQEIQQAQSYGIDGFELDMEGWSPSNTATWANFEAEAGYMFEAARELGTNFKLFFDLDCQGYGYDAACEAAAGQMMTAYGNHPNYYYYAGRPVFSGWKQGLNTTTGSSDDTFWSAALSRITSAGFNPFFIPMFSDWTIAANEPTTTYNNTEAWFTGGWLNSVAQGLMTWDGFIPSLYTQNNQAFDQVATNNSVLFATSVGSWFGQIRFLSEGINDSNGYVESLEFNGGEGLSSLWQGVINNQKPPMVLLTTWNDYTESYIGPADQADLTANNLPAWQVTGDYLFSHAAFTELNKYFIQWYKTGVQPTWPDAMYVFYRIAPMSVAASGAYPGTAISWNQQVYNPTLDDLYVTTILTSPATLTVTSGANVTTVSVGAEITHTRVPFAVGAQTFALSRSSAPLINITGANVMASLTYYYNVNPVSYYGYSP